MLVTAFSLRTCVIVRAACFLVIVIIVIPSHFALLFFYCSFFSFVCADLMKHRDQIEVNKSQSLDFSWDLRHILNLCYCFKI